MTNHERSSSKTLSSDLLGSTARKPAKPQPAVEIQQPRNEAPVSNGTNKPRVASSEYYPDPGRNTNSVSSPNGWDQSTQDFYQSQNAKPQYNAPPPPPRPGKMPDDSYPITPSASSTRPAFANGDYQPPRESSQYAYSRSDIPQAPTDFDQQSIGTRNSRNFFGKKR